MKSFLSKKTPILKLISLCNYKLAFFPESFIENIQSFFKRGKKLTYVFISIFASKLNILKYPIMLLFLIFFQSQNPFQVIYKIDCFNESRNQAYTLTKTENAWRVFPFDPWIRVLLFQKLQKAMIVLA